MQVVNQTLVEFAVLTLTGIGWSVGMAPGNCRIRIGAGGVDNRVRVYRPRDETCGPR